MARSAGRPGAVSRGYPGLRAVRLELQGMRRGGSPYTGYNRFSTRAALILRSPGQWTDATLSQSLRGLDQWHPLIPGRLVAEAAPLLPASSSGEGGPRRPAR